MALREIDYDLNRDIQQALDSLGEAAAPHELLLRHFRPRSMRPRAYARSYAMARRVQSLMIGPEDPIPSRPSPGWDLLVLFGLGYTLPDLERVYRNLESLDPHPAVLAGLPRAPLAVAEELRELAALERLERQPPYCDSEDAARELATHRDYLRRRVRELVQTALRPRAFRWRHRGIPLEWTPAEHRKAFFIQALEAIYPDTPTHRPAAARRALAGALEELLDRERPLLLSCSLTCGSSEVLQRTLLGPGILKSQSEHGSYRQLGVEEWPQGDSPELRLWRDLLDQLYGDRESERSESLADVLGWLAEPPRGLRGPVAQLFLGAALRVRSEDLELRQGDQTLRGDIETLCQALDRPSGYEVRYRVATRAEEAFVKAVRGLFGTSSMAMLAEGDLWQRTHRQLLTWLEHLPRLTRVLREAHSQGAQKLLQLLEGCRESHPRKLLSHLLPEIVGLTGIPPVEEQSIYLGRLDSLIQELEDFLASKMAELAQQVQRHIMGISRNGPEALEWLDRGARAWLEGLHPGTNSRPFSPWGEALRQAVLGEESVEQRWFVELPQALELAALADWSQDSGRTFLARIMQARAELELWKVQEVLAPGQDPVRLKEQVREWVHTSMELAGLSVPEREAVLLDLLDEMVWV